uniref:PHB domain-containing protein n=1 Tax=Angiostrongylus cantonensis TaxID=6313 RepID=A0A0K0CY02_ANGCA
MNDFGQLVVGVDAACTPQSFVLQGEVVTCEIDGNGAPSSITSFATRVSGASVALGQMISLLMLILVVWLMLLSTAAIIICSTAILVKSVRHKILEFRGFRYVQILTAPYFGIPIIRAAPAQYGADLKRSPVEGEIAIAEPLRACSALTNSAYVRGRIVLVERSDYFLVEQFLISGKSSLPPKNPVCSFSDGEFIQIDRDLPSVTFNFRLGSVNQSSEPSEHQNIVERHVTYLQDGIGFDHVAQRIAFFNLMRTAAYGALGLAVQDEYLKSVEGALRSAYLIPLLPVVYERLGGDITQV